MTVFTGYAPENFSSLQSQTKPLKARPIVLGYRGRDIGGRYGRLAFDKYEIGRRMREFCAERGVSHDIAMDEESRIYGFAWLDFVGDCRAMLGTESGSNVFDFDGSIMRNYQKLTSTLGCRPSYQEFATAEPLVADRDREINMGQISPRIFECAAMRTPMVLFEGSYSGAVKPHIHYIPLKRDFSNAPEVLTNLQDISALETMTERAHGHLIASNAFGYAAFWHRIGELVEARIESFPPRHWKTSVTIERRSSSLDNSFLLETPTREPLGSIYFETLNAHRELDLYAAEVGRLNLAYRAAIDKSLQSARQLFSARERRRPRGSKAREEAIGHLEAAEKGVLDRQAEYLAKAQAMGADLKSVAIDDRLRGLRALIDHHRRRAPVYTKDYRDFDALFTSTCRRLQPWPIRIRRLAGSLIERVKPHVRARPWLIGPI